MKSTIRNLKLALHYAVTAMIMYSTSGCTRRYLSSSAVMSKIIFAILDFWRSERISDFQCSWSFTAQVCQDSSLLSIMVPAIKNELNAWYIKLENWLCWIASNQSSRPAVHINCNLYYVTCLSRNEDIMRWRPEKSMRKKGQLLSSTTRNSNAATFGEE